MRQHFLEYEEKLKGTKIYKGPKPYESYYELDFLRYKHFKYKKDRKSKKVLPRFIRKPKNDKYQIEKPNDLEGCLKTILYQTNPKVLK